MRVYAVNPTMQAARDILRVLPMLAGVGATSSNGVEGTLQSNGYIGYDNLGLPFTVYSLPGQAVYGPTTPPPGVPIMAAQPIGINTNTTPQTGNSAGAWIPAPELPKAAVDFNAGAKASGGPAPEILTAADYTPAPGTDPNWIGKAAGDQIDFTATAADWLSRAGDLAPWYAWLAAGGGALILCAAMIHHHQQQHTGRKKR